MHPVLFRFFIPVYTYGACVALAFLIGIKITVDRGEKTGVDNNFIMNLSLVILTGSVLGARLLYVVEQWGYFRLHLNELWMVHRGGLSFFGGLIMALIASAIFVRLSGIPFLATADIFMPALALGQAIGRLGCYFNGCCYGIVNEGALGVMFPEGSPVFADHVARGWIPSSWFYSLPVVPVQLISSFADLMLFCILCVVDDRKKMVGTTFFMYLAGYGLIRFLIEYVRDDSPLLAMSLTLPQCIGLGGILVGLGGLLFIWHRPS